MQNCNALVLKVTFPITAADKHVSFSQAEMHRLSSVSSEQLEQKYQEYLQQNQEDAGVKFSAGHRFYELCFTGLLYASVLCGFQLY